MMLKFESMRGPFIPLSRAIWRGLAREAAGQQKWSGRRDNNGNEGNMGFAVTKNSE